MRGFLVFGGLPLRQAWKKALIGPFGPSAQSEKLLEQMGTVLCSQGIYSYF